MEVVTEFRGGCAEAGAQAAAAEVDFINEYAAVLDAARSEGAPSDWTHLDLELMAHAY